MKTLVLGASVKEERYSNMATKLLRECHHEVVAHGPKSGAIGDVKIQTSLEGVNDIDTVTLYLGQKNQHPFYEDILKIKPRRVIFNPGTENAELQSMLRENDIEFEEACTLVLLRTNQY